MAQWKWSVSGSTWADTTEQTAVSVACRVNSITIHTDTDQTEGHVQLWDVANPTPGTTAPDYAYCIPAATISAKRRHKILFPGGGVIFSTAVTLFVATAAGGATAVLTTAIPDDIIIDYTPLA